MNPNLFTLTFPMALYYLNTSVVWYFLLLLSTNKLKIHLAPNWVVSFEVLRGESREACLDTRISLSLSCSFNIHFQEEYVLV